MREPAGKLASSVSGTDTISWIWFSPKGQTGVESSLVARLTLTPTQLYVETDSAERLDTVKHQLAATFGFSLHFKGETTPPSTYDS